MDRRIVTCAGGIAIADLSLRLIHDSVGQSLAHEAMHACLVTAPRSEDTPQTASVAPRVQTRNPSLHRAVQWIEQNFTDPDCLSQTVEAAGTSARQLQRLFRIHLGLRPIQYLAEIRLNHGLAGELGPVVRDDAGGLAMNPDQGVQFACHPCPRDAGVPDQR